MFLLFCRAILVVFNVLLTIAMLIVVKKQRKEASTIFGYGIILFTLFGNIVALIGGMLN